MSKIIDWERISTTFVAALQGLCEQHVEIEESLGGFDNIQDLFLQGQLYGQQQVLLQLAQITQQLMPVQLPNFYEPETELRS